MLTPQLLLTLLIIAVIVLAWFASEFWEPRWLRVALGFFALIVVGGTAWLSASVLQRFNYNA